VKPVRNPFLILSGTCLLTLASVFLISQSPQAAEKLNKEEVQAIVREYLKSNPEIVIEAIETYQSNQQEIDARRFKDVIAQNKDALHGGDFPFAGNPDANVTVVEFFDYNCGYCKRALGDAAVKAIVITGAGKAFSGGADIKEFNTPAAMAEPTPAPIDVDSVTAAPKSVRPSDSKSRRPMAANGLASSGTRRMFENSPSISSDSRPAATARTAT